MLALLVFVAALSASPASPASRAQALLNQMNLTDKLAMVSLSLYFFSLSVAGARLSRPLRRQRRANPQASHPCFDPRRRPAGRRRRNAERDLFSVVAHDGSDLGRW
jgi:hypothetical protein